MVFPSLSTHAIYFFSPSTFEYKNMQKKEEKKILILEVFDIDRLISLNTITMSFFQLQVRNLYCYLKFHILYYYLISFFS